MRRIALLVISLFAVFGLSPPAAAAPLDSAPRRPIVSVVATDGLAVQTAIADWSVGQSPVVLHLSPSCIGYGHCIVVNYDPYFFQNTGNYGSATGVGDAIRGTCGITVTLLDPYLLNHEIGHCLGLEHNWVDTRSVMYQGGAGPYTGDDTPDHLDYRNADTAWGSTP